MTYAYVQENQVIRTGSLPASWKNYSNFPSHPSETHLEEGFYPIVYDDTPTIGLDEYLGAETFEIRATDVRSYRPVIVRTLEELQSLLKSQAKELAENFMSEKYGVHESIARVTGALGVPAKTAYETDLSNTIQAYVQFAGEVDACNTKAELLVVYNNYPQLH